MAADTPIQTHEEESTLAATTTPEASENEATRPSPLSGGLGILVALILLSTAGYLAYQSKYNPEPTPLDPPAITYICADSGKTFEHKPQVGETNPILSPFSNKKTAYPAEKCYWTKDGKQKRAPTFVLLNEHLGIDKPTICPDCGRLVINHNPLPPTGTPFEKSNDAPASQPADNG
ncbi:MAG: hypothetical protein KDA33_14250 [Phycisphaerales bacterium]|nr:hypothetical protein [Phycisphaerales bacterium]